MKITKFFLDKATYKIVGYTGQEVSMKIDYWNNTYVLSGQSDKLENVARNMLKKKHRVNFAWKFQEPAGPRLAGTKK